MADAVTDPAAPRRLCSEIQLFDLCDLEVCRCKSGIFCTSPELLTRFEAIAEDDHPAAQVYSVDTDDADEGDDESEWDDQEYCDDPDAGWH